VRNKITQGNNDSPQQLAIAYQNTETRLYFLTAWPSYYICCRHINCSVDNYWSFTGLAGSTETRDELLPYDLMVRHMIDILTSCAQTMFALRTLWAHGMPLKTTNTVFEVVVEAMLCNAGTASYGYITASWQQIALESRTPYGELWGLDIVSVDFPTFDNVISIADDRLFERVSMENGQQIHLSTTDYSAASSTMRRRSHNYVLPINTYVNSSTCITRLLYKNNCYH